MCLVVGVQSDFGCGHMGTWRNMESDVFPLGPLDVQLGKPTKAPPKKVFLRKHLA